MGLFKELKRRNVIRVAAAYLIIGWLLAQVSTTLEAALNLPSWFDTLIVTVMLIGFPIALIISWVYELTPEGFKKEKDIKSDETITHETSKKLNYITLVAAIAVAGMFIWQQMNPQVIDSGNIATNNKDENNTTVIPEQVGIQSGQVESKLTLGVAVLPFANMSEEPNNAFFAGGVYEDVLTYLSRIVQWRVISRTSMEKIAERGMEITAIGKHLDVSHVLEGSVRRAGDSVRVTVQLIDASNDEHIWAENYDRKLEDIFAIQTEIAEKIAQQLKTTLTPEQHRLIATRPTDNIGAYDLFIKVRELSRVWSGSEGFLKQIPLLESAIQLDPNFVEAQVMLVQSYGRIFWTGEDYEGAYRPKAETLKNQIVADYPDSFYAYAAQGYYDYTIERNYPSAIGQLQLASLERPDDIEILSYIGSSNKRIGNFEQGIAATKKILSLDPEDVSNSNELVTNLILANRIKEALAQAKNNVKKFPKNANSKTHLANIYLKYFGDLESYYAIFENDAEYNNYEWLYSRLKARENFSKTINTLEQLKLGETALNIAIIDLKISEILNINGEEIKSQKYALKGFETIKNVITNENFLEKNPAAKVRYAFIMYFSCLANDKDAYKLLEEKFHTIKDPDIYILYAVNKNYANALAECGDTLKAWSILNNLTENPNLDITKWTLALDPLYQYYFSDIPEYQDMVKALKAEKSQKAGSE
jgi:TolB-like protein